MNEGVVLDNVGAGSVEAGVKDCDVLEQLLGISVGPLRRRLMNMLHL